MKIFENFVIFFFGLTFIFEVSRDFGQFSGIRAILRLRNYKGVKHGSSCIFFFWDVFDDLSGVRFFVIVANNAFLSVPARFWMIFRPFLPDLGTTYLCSVIFRLRDFFVEATLCPGKRSSQFLSPFL